MHVEMNPAPGGNLLRFVGDQITFSLRAAGAVPQAFLRTNLGRGFRLHADIVEGYKEELARWKLPAIEGAAEAVPKGLAWRDIPMRQVDGVWRVTLTVTEVGHFQAKAYVVDEYGKQVWPHGPNLGISVGPSDYRSGNTIYCAFTRMFGESKTEVTTNSSPLEPQLARLDKLGYAAIPPSGKIRDLIREMPHIFETLGCRILHLLPINPTPTTYARFGRFGSPYAVQDLMAVDPALVEFDRRTTGVDQFRELTYAVHSRGGRVILDIVINHTGWGSDLQENHPEWFLRDGQGRFESPGAWGTTWEDLVELDHRMPLSWEYLAEVFITWCRRGVDGFRCDAGYKVPTAAWQYIVAKVRHEFPKALFLLEGLGGSWEATNDLLTRGGMQWAYSELFQNYEPEQVSGYLEHSIQTSERVGTLIHYSETHDNPRLAEKGRTWSLLRNQLCALASHNGGFAFTCGVEWLASERINVHSSRGLAWNNPDNLIPELSQLTELLAEHPCFLDGATVQRVSAADSPVLALIRVSADREDQLLVLVNLNHEMPRSYFLDLAGYRELGEPAFDLLTGGPFKVARHQGNVEFALGAGQSVCLAVGEEPKGLRGTDYRKARAEFAWAAEMMSHTLEPECLGAFSWKRVAEFVRKDPGRFLGAIAAIDPELARADLLQALQAAAGQNRYREVVDWRLSDAKRLVPVPPRHWILIEDDCRFRGTLRMGETLEHIESVEINGKHIGAFPPMNLLRRARKGRAVLSLERYGTEKAHLVGEVLYMDAVPAVSRELKIPFQPKGAHLNAPMVLLTNGVGGMARMCVDLGQVKSKYDCVLAANLHPSVPVDRHVFVKRVRVWANADRYISPLDGQNLKSFSPGPPARWEFSAIAGDGRTVGIEMKADMLDGSNTTVLQFQLVPDGSHEVRISVRFDIEDRNFHSETHHNSGAEFHFQSNCRNLPERVGFEFRPADDRHLKVYANAGQYHPAPEWSDELAHPVEQTRGQVGAGDSFSPGWFDIPLKAGEPVRIVLTAEKEDPASKVVEGFEAQREVHLQELIERSGFGGDDSFGRQFVRAAAAFLVRRNREKTVIAGYPWFLDWGRDSLICARGLLAAGFVEETKQLLKAFGKFEKDGTMPNTIHGEDASNRNTTDAPLWYGVVCEEFAREVGPEIYGVAVDSAGRTILEVLRDLAVGFLKGTSNGIAVDEASGLVWSPKHFTWMDTNYPAGTPREGYPIEIQGLWIRLLRQLERLGATHDSYNFGEVRARAEDSLLKYYWLEEKGYFADVLLAPPGLSAAKGLADDALRSNCVIPITLGLVPKEQARRCLAEVARYLVIPGALRSLAPLPLTHPLPIHAPDWRLLNNPKEPYRGRYEGDEDTQRKPAYHNGTAWTWTFPGFCEALAQAWDFSPESILAARAYLGSMSELVMQGCLGQMPEVLDGDAPHQQRGCDAQAWGVTEGLRVWKLLQKPREELIADHGIS